MHILTEVEIGFSETMYSVSEGEGEIKMEVHSEGQLERIVKVLLSTKDGSAIGTEKGLNDAWIHMHPKIFVSLLNNFVQSQLIICLLSQSLLIILSIQKFWSLVLE